MPPTQRRSQAERSAATQARLLGATCACLAELGYHGTSSAEVCRRAGVSRGAQLHHYPTKADLFAASVEHLFDLRHAEFRHAIRDAAADLPSALTALWGIYSGPTLGAWQELVVASRTDAVLRQRVAQVNDRFAREAERTFRTLFDLPPEAPVREATRLLVAVLDGLALNHVLDPDEELPRAVIGQAVALLRPWVQTAGDSHE